jgi:hypothetical protein
MKAMILFLSLAFLASSASVFAATYSCDGTYDRKISFELKVWTQKAQMSVTHHSCKLVSDPNYRPTAKYEGYSRFHLVARQGEACHGFMEEMMGKGNGFDSMKVSPELLAGEDEGSLTFVYDDGDYHGQLANSRVKCWKK